MAWAYISRYGLEPREFYNDPARQGFSVALRALRCFQELGSKKTTENRRNGKQRKKVVKKISPPMVDGKKDVGLRVCPVLGCNWTNNRKTELTKHMKFRHSTSGDYSCPKQNCVESFPTQEDLKEHLAKPGAGHGKARPDVSLRIYCDLDGCGLSFLTAEGLAYHWMYAGMSHAPTNRCVECSKAASFGASANKKECPHGIKGRGTTNRSIKVAAPPVVGEWDMREEAASMAAVI